MKKTAHSKRKTPSFEHTEIERIEQQKPIHKIGDQKESQEVVDSPLPLYFIPKEHQQIGDLKTIVFNVGQGDHCLLQFPDGKYGIIDFYYEATDSALSEPPAISYFRNLPPEEELTIAFICITHTDYDHLKGIKESVDYLLERENTTIENIWLPAADDVQDVLKEIMKEVKYSSKAFFSRFSKKEIQKIEATLGKLTELNETLDAADSTKHSWPIMGIKILTHQISDIQIDCLGPLYDHLKEYGKKISKHILKQIINNLKRDDKAAALKLDKKELDQKRKNEKQKAQRSAADPNAISAILRIEFDQHQLLFPGDITLESWEECFTQFQIEQKTYKLSDLQPNFIKGTHHGSHNNSSPEFWSQVLPLDGEVHITFSAGSKRHNYQHPDGETYGHMDQAKKARNGNGEAAVKVKRRKTNKCIQCLEQNCKPHLATTDLFAYREETEANRTTESKLRKKIFDQLAREESIFLNTDLPAKKNNGLLGFYYEFKEGKGREVDFKMLMSKGMKRYESCLFGGNVETECPQPISASS